jgi:hypothetical protein
MNLFATTPEFAQFPTFRLSETAHPDVCAKCKSAVWTLIVGGFKVHLDPEPLDAMAKLVAHISKRYTFTLWSVGELFEAEYRSRIHIINPDQSKIVLAAHICNGNIRSTLQDFFKRSTSIATSEKAGF